MPLAEQPSIAGGNRHSQGAAILESQHQRPPDQRNIGDVVVRGPFDPVQAGNRHAGADEHPLIPADGVAHASENGAVLDQLAGSRRLLDQRERRVLHDFILLTKSVIVTFPWYARRAAVTYRNRRFPREIRVI